MDYIRLEASSSEPFKGQWNASVHHASGRSALWHGA